MIEVLKIRMIQRILVLTVIAIIIAYNADAQLSLPDSPAGMVVSQDMSRYDRSWYFCESGNLQMIEDKYPEKSIHHGRWRIKNDTIYYTLKVHFGKRGIGSPWKHGKEIGFNEYVDYVFEIKQDSFLLWKKGNKDSLKIVKKNYKCPLNFYAPQLPGKFPVASYRILQDKDLSGLTLEDLNLMKLEVYGRYGKKFDNPQSTNLLINEEWYFPHRDQVDDLMTNIEKRNVGTIDVYMRKLKAKK